MKQKKNCINCPDKKAAAKGLCFNCYNKLLYKTNPEYKRKSAERAKERYEKDKNYTYEKNKQRRLANPVAYKAKMREQHLKRLYGLTPADFAKILIDQENRCKICGTIDFGKKGPSVDHDHSTGKVRAILCGRCNKAIGLMDDNPDKLKLAAEYLEFHVKN